MPIETFKPQFVRAIPDNVEEGILYVSPDYHTAVHKCACGCGRNVITPFGPAQWTLTFDGNVSLHPSIGNWSFPCRSHYLVHSNAVVWAGAFSDEEIAFVKTHDRDTADRYYNPPPPAPAAVVKSGFWRKMWKGLTRR